MMKSSVFLILLVLPYFLIGQVEISEGILPKANDVYSKFIDEYPNIRIGKQGRDQNWDYTSLSSGILYTTRMKSPDPVSIFNQVDYDFFLEEPNSIFRMFKRIGSQVFEVAIQRPHPLNSDYIVFSRYEQPLLVTYGPLRYRSEKTNRSLIYHKMPGENIPDLIKKKLPITADSLRLKIRMVTDFRVDSEGVMNLSYDRFDVLRQEVSTRKITSLEIYSAGKWSQVNSNLIDPSQELLGTSTEKKYIFYSDEESLPLVTIHLEEDNTISKAEIKAPEEAENYIEANSELEQLILSPNPTYGDVKLELMNLSPGDYKFEVFNIIGKKLWGEEVEISRKVSAFKYNFSFLGKGTYLWALTNAQGVRITTKRLVIVTP